MKSDFILQVNGNCIEISKKTFSKLFIWNLKTILFTSFPAAIFLGITWPLDGRYSITSTQSLHVDPNTTTKSLSVIIFVIEKKKQQWVILRTVHSSLYASHKVDTNSTNKHSHTNPILTHKHHHWFYKHICIRHKFSFFSWCRRIWIQQEPSFCTGI